MGWGEPGVGPAGVVHYAYAGAGTSGDVGDIFYVRSTDNGRTWSAPVKLNDDVDNAFHTQWMPSLSTDKNGNVNVSWYDRRAATTTCTVATDPGCSYERVGRQSTNNGVSFGTDITISSALIPQPTQTDSGVQACYAGDYDYDTAQNGNAYDTWTDGRRAVGGVQVQDVEFAVPVSVPGATVSPTAINFGSRLETAPPVDRVATLTNNTSASISITSIGASLNPPFAVIGTTCGSSLVAGASCTITVEFTPADGNIGPNTDTMSIIDSAPNSPQNVALSGIVRCPPRGCLQ
jgi:hypothetical protein